MTPAAAMARAAAVIFSAVCNTTALLLLLFQGVSALPAAGVLCLAGIAIVAITAAVQRAQATFNRLVEPPQQATGRCAENPTGRHYR